MKVRGLIDQLVDPDLAFRLPSTAGEVIWTHDVLAIAQTCYTEQDWPALAHLYGRAADIAWNQGKGTASLRLLLAERCVAERIDDQRRLRECTYFLATRHRLQGHFLPAEAWARDVLRSPQSADSALMHVAALRELASISEVCSDYDTGLSFCDEAESICRAYSDQTGMTNAHAKTLLHRSLLLRLCGRLDAALDSTRQARQLAAEDADDLTKGLIELREGGIQIVIGRADVALAAYQAAERYFASGSKHNLLITKMRQISCLRALGRTDDALALADELAELFPGQTDYRRGQVHLERAEVQHAVGDEAGALRTLEQARPFFEHGTHLEALRWHLHIARVLINRGEDMPEARRLLRHVLRSAVAPGHTDLTRTMLALHNVARLPYQAGIQNNVRLGASHGALLAAELQRDALTNPAERWSLHGLREEIYTAAVVLHATMGNTEEVAKITELGRADLLNQLLSGNGREWSGSVSELPIVPGPPDPNLASSVFAMAEEVCSALEEGGANRRIDHLPLGEVLAADPVLDDLADVIVMSHLAYSGSDWAVSVATRLRHGDWSVVTEDAPPAVAALLDKLNAAVLLPARGISSLTWEQLGTFLLPDPAIWSGSYDNPHTVLVCPDPRLWQVPYAALTRHGILLSEVAEVRLTPSLRTSTLLRDRARRRTDTAGSVAMTRPALALLEPGLPGHGVELAALTAWPGGLRPLEGIDGLGGDHESSLLYVSGHGDKPGAAAHLGLTKLTLDRLAASVLSPTVFLNGCWSGVTDGRFGQDPLSLAVGALIGGAEVVVAGIGRIGSVASAHIAAHTLELCGQGHSVSSALRFAQYRIRAAHPELHAFDWAGLSVVGTRGDIAG